MKKKYPKRYSFIKLLANITGTAMSQIIDLTQNTIDQNENNCIA